jgi:DNA-binding NarL/FixJ family response regulator
MSLHEVNPQFSVESAKLLPREVECLKLYAQGFSMRKIGIGLNISKQTVIRDLDSVRQKLGGLHTANEAIVRAVELKEIDLKDLVKDFEIETLKALKQEEEQQLFLAIVEDAASKTYEEIALQFGSVVSGRTIKRRSEGLLKRLGLRNRTHALTCSLEARRRILVAKPEIDPEKIYIFNPPHSSVQQASLRVWGYTLDLEEQATAANPGLLNKLT